MTREKVKHESMIRRRMAEEETIREKIDKNGNRWTKVYFGGGAHFKNWLSQFIELNGEENVKVEEADSRGFQCYEESGEKMYRIWVKDRSLEQEMKYDDMHSFEKGNSGLLNHNYMISKSKKRTGHGGTKASPFDDLAGDYDAWFDKEGSLIFSIEARAFKLLLPSLAKPWLEIGVGSGRFAQTLGIETGVDPSIRLVEMARKRGVNATMGQGEQHFFDEESFGTVFLIVTLCFLDSPTEVLKEANRILMPGGKLVLGLFLKESPWGKFYQQKKEEGHRFYKYATFYSCDEVVRLIVRAGFMTERIISTLFQRPGKVHHTEEPKEGYFPDAGFTMIVAEKER